MVIYMWYAGLTISHVFSLQKVHLKGVFNSLDTFVSINELDIFKLTMCYCAKGCHGNIDLNDHVVANVWRRGRGRKCCTLHVVGKNGLNQGSFEVAAYRKNGESISTVISEGLHSYANLISIGQGYVLIWQ